MLQLPLYQPQPTNFSQFSLFDFFGSFFNLNPELIWLAAAIPGIFFIIASFVLSYHWKRFSMDKLVMTQASILYFSVSALLILTMTISLIFYINSI